MLYLISLGISDERDISLRGLETGKKCEKLYWEQYTDRLRITEQRREELFGKGVETIQRSGLEEGSRRIVEEAREKNVGILVGGDALSATTHLSLISDCRKVGVPFRVIHGSSVLTAVAECGLSLYKFGETVTIPRWKKNFRPAGFYETILKNKEAGLHTLVLLDIGMTLEEGAGMLKGLDRQGIFSSEKIVSVSCLGSRGQEIRYVTLVQARGKAPAAILVPGKLNDFEKEFLESLA